MGGKTNTILFTGTCGKVIQDGLNLFVISVHMQIDLIGEYWALFTNMLNWCNSFLMTTSYSGERDSVYLLCTNWDPGR